MRFLSKKPRPGPLSPLQTVLSVDGVTPVEVPLVPAVPDDGTALARLLAEEDPADPVGEGFANAREEIARVGEVAARGAIDWLSDPRVQGHEMSAPSCDLIAREMGIDWRTGMPLVDPYSLNGRHAEEWSAAGAVVVAPQGAVEGEDLLFCDSLKASLPHAS